MKPGERIPADGVVETGESLVDESVVANRGQPCAVEATQWWAGASTQAAR